jgi:stage II sporulation protein D
MKKYALLRYCLVFLAIVLPYFSAAAINGPEMVLAERVPDMEEYLPVIVFSQISPEMKKETIKRRL